MTFPPNLLHRQQALWDLLAHKPAGFITDVDGVLSPIVDRPDGAFVHPRVPDLLRRIIEQLELVAAVSGRPIPQLLQMVPVDGMVYVGNHGLEWWKEGRATVVPDAQPFLPSIAATTRHLREQLGSQDILVEDKGATGTIHYRLSEDPAAAREAILQALAECPSARGLQIAEGRMVVNVLPPIETNKGTAVEMLVRNWRLSGAIYLGDDVTDVDAFLALKALRRSGVCEGISVAVSSPEAPSDLIGEADYLLEGVDAVVCLLEQMADRLDPRKD